MPPLLEIDNLHAGYGQIEVLKGISLEVQPGEVLDVDVGAVTVDRLLDVEHDLRDLARRHALELRHDGVQLDAADGPHHPHAVGRRRHGPMIHRVLGRVSGVRGD